MHQLGYNSSAFLFLELHSRRLHFDVECLKSAFLRISLPAIAFYFLLLPFFLQCANLKFRCWLCQLRPFRPLAFQCATFCLVSLKFIDLELTHCIAWFLVVYLYVATGAALCAPTHKYENSASLLRHYYETHRLRSDLAIKLLCAST